jgi:acetyl-CoA acyltransferase
MMREVKVTGVGMTRFGKFPDQSLKAIGEEAVRDALVDAEITERQIQAAFVGNAMAGLITGQECIRGQVILRSLGLDGVPVYNIENACASGSTAFHTAWMAVCGEMYDVVLALGVEKLYHEDKKKSYVALQAAADIETSDELRRKLSADLSLGAEERAEEKRSLFMDFYASEARQHTARYGTRREDYALVAVKNRMNGSLNPRAQFQRAISSASRPCSAGALPS